MDILIINGPNLEMLIHRDSSIYGTEDLAAIQKYCDQNEAEDSFKFRWLQSSNENELIKYIHEAIETNTDGIIINPAALSHTSIAVLDAMYCYKGLIIEVHLSNIHKRELLRQTRMTAKRADAVIEGLGKESYRLAINAMKNYLKNKREN